ncbi:Hypothetical predicted protein [Prunus dulcis]|uniref:Uncharacterized protein n=1 Tax=Prunus dulcis TaxID=3755 RepID=A0A5E4ETJ8_PRUDU|nr:Hypothetical predicted protein [Prunus dulcis]
MEVPLFNLAPNLTDSESDSLALPLILKYKFILHAGMMTFGKQNTFPESFGLLNQAFLSGINFFDSTEMYPMVVSEPRLRVRGGARSVVLATKRDIEILIGIPRQKIQRLLRWRHLHHPRAAPATGKKQTILAQSTMELEMIAMASESKLVEKLTDKYPFVGEINTDCSYPL